MKWIFRLMIVVVIGVVGYRTPIFGMEQQASTTLVAYNESCATDAGDYLNKIYVTDWQSGIRSVLSEQAVAYLPPSWLPDGKQLAYTVDRGSYYDVVVHDLETGSVRSLTEGKDRLNNSPSWSPNGHSIAFFGLEQIGIYDTLTDQLQNFPLLTVNNTAVSAWSPDGNSIVVSGAYPDKPIEIYILNLVSGEVQDLSQGQFDLVGSPAWSPDGRYITFFGSHFPTSAIYLADLQTHTLTQLSKNDAQNYISSAWSPDGQTIATGTVESEMHLFDRQGNLMQKINLQQQILGLGAGEGRVQWSPDGRYLVLYAPVNSQWGSYAYELTTGEVYPLSPDNRCDYSPVMWQPNPSSSG